MEELIGDKLRSLRKFLKLSQKVLAYGICDQSEISRIERNQYKPSFHVIKKISERLGVNVNYFLEENSEQEAYVNEVKLALHQARRNRDYQDMHDIVTSEINTPFFKDEENLNFLKWNKGIVLYHLYQKKEQAIELMVSCLSSRDWDFLYTELDLDVLNSVGLIHRGEGNLEEAKFYLEHAYKTLNKWTVPNSLRTKLKVMYNLSKVYTDLHQFRDSLDLCSKGLTACQENEDLFLFAEFHYQLGRNHLMMGNKQGLSHYEKARLLLEYGRGEGYLRISEQIEKEITIYKREGIVI